jgi:membrane-bound lytic murein transglycosylase A
MAVWGRAFRISTGAGLLSLVLVGVAAAQAEDVEPFKLPDAQLEPVKWSDLPGWTADDHLAAFAAFQVSCGPFRSAKRPRDTRPVYVALADVPAGGGASVEGPLGALSSRTISGRCGSTAWASRRLPDRLHRPIVDGSRGTWSRIPFPLCRRPPDWSPPATTRAPMAFPTRA